MACVVKVKQCHCLRQCQLDFCIHQKLAPTISSHFCPFSSAKTTDFHCQMNGQSKATDFLDSPPNSLSPQPLGKEEAPASILRTVGVEMKASHGYGGGPRMVQHGRVHTDDILNINVGGKKYTVRRTDLLADPRSKLADLFRPGTTRLIPSDKGGNFYLDRDPKSFRHVLAYLRFKKERCVASLALPSKPDELAKLVGECEALNLVELREMALEMLQKYLRTEEQHYVTSFVQMSIRDFDAWQFEKEQNSMDTKGGSKNPSINSSAFDEWDNI